MKLRSGARNRITNTHHEPPQIQYSSTMPANRVSPSSRSRILTPPVTAPVGGDWTVVSLIIIAPNLSRSSRPCTAVRGLLNGGMRLLVWETTVLEPANERDPFFGRANGQ